ncbi:MAG: hypothetical protein ACTSUB_04125, partial [Candidatus Thorarchaeota archaeon]
MVRQIIDPKMMWLLKKEIKTLIRSRWLIIGLIISPIFAFMFQGAFLSFIVGQTTEETEMVYITNEDTGEWGQSLYTFIQENKDGVLLIEPLIDVTKQEGENLVANKSLSVWVYIPSNFTVELDTTTTSTL